MGLSIFFMLISLTKNCMLWNKFNFVLLFIPWKYKFLFRFGKIVCCEVIRDKKTGDSLQYAFVEFDNQASCEQAYFKMDNVLIDDRRIHVDFSQSVSKYRWKGKGRLEVMDEKKGGGDLKNEIQKRRQTSPSRRPARAHSRERYVKHRSQIRERSRDRRPEPDRRREKENVEKSKDRRRSRSKDYRDKDYQRSNDRVRQRSRSRDLNDKRRDVRERSRERRRSVDKKREHKDRSRSRDMKRTSDRRDERRIEGKTKHRRERSYSWNI